MFGNEGDKKEKRKKYEMLKATITVGIQKREKWKSIQRAIVEEEIVEDEDFDRIIYGNGWYIKIGERNSDFDQESDFRSAWSERRVKPK